MAATPVESEEAPHGRAVLIRDVLIFQLKLVVDGLRDLLLSPVSLLMGLLDVLTGGNRFYRLLTLGRRSESYINLFGTHDQPGLDETVSRIEQLVSDEYRKGGITASARRAVNRALDKLVNKDNNV